MAAQAISSQSITRIAEREPSHSICASFFNVPHLLNQGLSEPNNKESGSAAASLSLSLSVELLPYSIPKNVLEEEEEEEE
jgi:hypothetical protein